MKKERCFSVIPAVAKVLLVTMAAFLAACAGVGNAVRVADPVKSAETLKVKGDYTYYYDGRVHMPFTIVGLDKSYALKTKYFKTFDPQNGMLQAMIKSLHTKNNTIRPVLLEIVEPDGKVVGFVYTSEHQMTIRLGAYKTLNLDAPYSHGSHAGPLTGN